MFPPLCFDSSRGCIIKNVYLLAHFFFTIYHLKVSPTSCGAFQRSRCACGKVRSMAPAFIYRALGEHKLPRLYWHLELCDLYTPILLHTRARSRSQGNSPQAAAACQAPLLIWTSPAEVGMERVQESRRTHQLRLLLAINNYW